MISAQDLGLRAKLEVGLDSCFWCNNQSSHTTVQRPWASRVILLNVHKEWNASWGGQALCTQLDPKFCKQVLYNRQFHRLSCLESERLEEEAQTL